MAETWDSTKSALSHFEKIPQFGGSTSEPVLQTQNERLPGPPTAGVFVGLGHLAWNVLYSLFNIRVHSRPQDAAVSQRLHVNTSQMC